MISQPPSFTQMMCPQGSVFTHQELRMREPNCETATEVLDAGRNTQVLGTFKFQGNIWKVYANNSHMFGAHRPGGREWIFDTNTNSNLEGNDA